MSSRARSGVNHPIGWIIALALGLAARGRSSAAFQGFLIAYVEIPSFVVTLGGLLVFRGLIWQLSGGTTVAPDDADVRPDRRRAGRLARRRR